MSNNVLTADEVRLIKQCRDEREKLNREFHELMLMVKDNRSQASQLTVRQLASKFCVGTATIQRAIKYDAFTRSVEEKNT